MRARRAGLKSAESHEYDIMKEFIHNGEKFFWGKTTTYTIRGEKEGLRSLFLPTLSFRLDVHFIIVVGLIDAL